MNYEINVVRNGKHYFATHPRSLTDPNTIREVADDFRKRFPASEGFRVIVYRVETSMHQENHQ